MSKEFVPSGFDKAAILQGLHTAMGFGQPTRTEDRATFFLPAAVTPTNQPAPFLDLGGVPFDPTQQRSIPRPKKVVPCAVEFYDGGQVIEQFGSVSPTRIKITLLDPDYQQVKGFDYVVAGGDKYLYDKTEPPVALGTIDVWTCWASAENER